MRLETRGFRVLALRQPIPSTHAPGIIYFCPQIMMDIGFNGLRTFDAVLLQDGDSLDAKMAGIVRAAG